MSQSDTDRPGSEPQDKEPSFAQFRNGERARSAGQTGRRIGAGRSGQPDPAVPDAIRSDFGTLGSSASKVPESSAVRSGTVLCGNGRPDWDWTGREEPDREHADAR